MAETREQLPEAERLERRARTQAFLANQDALDLMVERIASGEHLRTLCIEHAITYSTTQVYLAEHMPKAYDAAKRVRADSAIDDLEALEGKLENGEINFNDFRELANSKKWRAEKLNPKAYGEHQNIDMKVTDQTRLHLEAIRSLTRITVIPNQRITKAGTDVAFKSLTKDADKVVDAAFAEVANTVASVGA